MFGVTSITGAVLGGVALMLLPVLQADHASIGGLLFVVLAVGAVLLARDPNGLANQLFKLGRWLEGQIAPRIRANLPSLPGSGGEPRESAELEPSGAKTEVTASEGVPAHAH